MMTADLDGAREVLEQFEAEATGTRRRGEPGDDPLAARPGRVARRSLAAGARARDCRLPAHRPDAASACPGVGRPGQGADRDRSRSRRGGPVDSRRGPLLLSRLRSGCTRPSSKPCSVVSSSCSGTSVSPPRSLRQLPQRLAAGEMNDPTLTVWPDTIETLVALGELERAGAYLERFAGNAERLDSPLARAGALRCRGLLSAAEGRPGGGLRGVRTLARRRRAVPARACPHAPRPRHCPDARTQQKKAAREALEQALALFDHARRPSLGREGPGRAETDKRPHARLRGAHRDRAPRRRACRPGSFQQGNRRRALHGGSAPSRPTSPTSTASSTSAAPGSRRASRPLRAPRPMPGERLPKPRVSRVSGPRP